MILLFTGLAVTIFLTATLVYHVTQMRNAYTKQREDIDRGISAIRELQTLQTRLSSFTQQVESNAQELEKIGAQIEAGVSELIDSLPRALKSSFAQHAEFLKELHGRFQAQQERFDNVIHQLNHRPGSNSNALSQPARQELDHRGRLGKESLNQDPQLRFSVLIVWVSVNSLAILRRASNEWKTVDDLIEIIPSDLEPEAEILDNRVLVVGTRGHFEKLALAIRELDPSSELTQWFDMISGPETPRTAPAVLVRSNDYFRLVSKGKNSAAMR